MTEAERRFRFPIGAQRFLARAKNHLAKFDDERDVESLFHAALAVRIGIEARVYEYIDVALGDVKPLESGIRKYRARELLFELAKLNGVEDHHVSVRIRRSDQDSGGVMLEYRPVTKALERAHERMGALLHYSIFWLHPSWWVNARSRRGSFDTLLDARDVVAEAIEELDYVTAGNLLADPTVSRRVAELAARRLGWRDRIRRVWLTMRDLFRGKPRQGSKRRR